MCVCVSLCVCVSATMTSSVSVSVSLSASRPFQSEFQCEYKVRVCEVRAFKVYCE